ncbi:Crp/Fnr family transcriptional regulator [Gallaecimonas sp. GXIMD4217]|uniref:Crp/Fnr family transcriptional regulator n=1 Tax=Gallaecimonas sp. GXIMD4217 TaxID=3131927 RepID=UPI00311B4209
MTLHGAIPPIVEPARYFAKLGVAEDAFRAQQAQLKPVQAAAGTVLLAQGQYQHHAYLVQEGLIRACHYREDGTERCKEFYFPGELCLLYNSWLSGVPAAYQLETLDAVTALRLPLSVLEAPGWQAARLALLQRQLLYKEQKEAFLLLNSPEQRYRHLCRHAPHWLTQLNQVQLANYIGISPISLSRLRRRINQG